MSGHHDAHGHEAHPHGSAGATHDHGRAHHHARASARALGLALLLTIAFAGVEVAVGLVGNSLALIADAGHMLSDAAALAIALYAFRLGQKAPTSRQTYGFRRAEILAALLNAVVVATMAVFVTRAAILRWAAPSQVHGREVMLAAAVGLGVNIAAARILRGSAQSNLNTRAAYLHVLGDLLGSVGALASGAFVILLGWNRADSALSVGISLILLWGAWRLIRETTHLLMEGAPPGLDVAAIERAITGVAGVASVHDLHVWSITSGVPALTAHVVLASGAHGVPVAMEVSRLLQMEFGIEHATIQPEAGPAGHRLVTIATRRSA